MVFTLVDVVRASPYCVISLPGCYVGGRQTQVPTPGGSWLPELCFNIKAIFLVIRIPIVKIMGPLYLRHGYVIISQTFMWTYPGLFHGMGGTT